MIVPFMVSSMKPPIMRFFKIYIDIEITPLICLFEVLYSWDIFTRVQSMSRPTLKNLIIGISIYDFFESRMDIEITRAKYSFSTVFMKTISTQIKL